MSTLKANVIDSTTATSDFVDKISANGDNQWLDTYGVIKTNRDTIAENVTIPAGTNGFSAGAITVANGRTVDVQGEWVIV